MSNQAPQPRPPADRDDTWVAMVIAFGALGGVLGWTIFQPPWLQDTQPPTQGGRFAEQGELPSLAVEPPQRPFPLKPLPDQIKTADPSPAPQTDETNDNMGPASSPGEASTPGEVPDQQGSTDSAPEPLSVIVPEPSVPVAETSTDNGLPPQTAPLVFADVSPDYWAKSYIDTLTQRGILAGFPDGTFAPDRAMTRAEFATQLAQAFELPVQADAPSSFVDIAADHWATAGIQEAVTTGFMKGYPNAVFQPEQTVPRAQVIVAIAAGLQLQSADPAVLYQYQDQAEIPAWAQEKIAAALAANIVTGQPNPISLRPNQAATRAEVAAMLYYALAYLGELPTE